MGAEPVVVLYASISVLNWMRATTGSQCKETKQLPSVASHAVLSRLTN